MKNWTQLVFLWLGTLGLLVSHSATGWAHDPAKEPNPYGLILETPEGIFIQAEDKQLATVLHLVENKSGIKIDLPGHLNNDRLNAVVDQPDWPSAIRRLLTNYSTIEIGKNPLLKVKVLDRTGNMQVFDERKPAVHDRGDGTLVQNGFVYRPVKRIKKKVWANESIPYSQSQLEQIVGDHFYGPLPNDVLKDPVLGFLLKKHGVSTEKDLDNISKALAVRAEAGKMLRVLKKREYLNGNPPGRN